MELALSTDYRIFIVVFSTQGSGSRDDKSPTDEVARTPSPIEPIRYKVR